VVEGATTGLVKREEVKRDTAQLDLERSKIEAGTSGT
jgi:hypothetical protein